MKLNYEQYRMLAPVLGPSNDRIVVKNKKGKILKPALDRWHQSHKETKYTCLGERQKLSHALLGCHSPISLHPSSLPRRRQVVKP